MPLELVAAAHTGSSSQIPLSIVSQKYHKSPRGACAIDSHLGHPQWTSRSTSDGRGESRLVHSMADVTTLPLQVQFKECNKSRCSASRYAWILAKNAEETALVRRSIIGYGSCQCHASPTKAT